MLRASRGWLLVLPVVGLVGLGDTGCGSSISAPTNLQYSVNPAAYTKGTAIGENVPKSSGGAVASYAVLPALPGGLNISPSTGVISGTPSVVAATASYTVTATNSGGSTTAAVTITVVDVAPGDLTYSDNPVVYAEGAAITANTPSNSGGTVVSYSVAPPLPPGLSLNSATGVISGTPSADTATGNYTVTGTNSGGSTTDVLNITVKDVAPSNLVYSTNPAVYSKGIAITANTPSNAGGGINSYRVSPPLPAGLSLSTTTGIISGTPTAVSAMATYAVTGTNAVGSAMAGVTISVQDAPPSNLTYSTNPAVYTKLSLIPPNVPSNTGGTVVSYAVSPALPAGLSLNVSTGVISGTPTAITATASYVVTATNALGNTKASVSITVNDLPPSNLTYSSNPAVYTKGIAIAPNAPSSAGGAVVSYSVSPPLPAGLSLNTATGIISGTPTTITAAGSHTVTATNTGGSTTVGVTITVNDVAPSNLSYTTNPAVYLKGTAIAPNAPSSAGGAVVSYSVSPPLSAGLSLNAATGVISGAPTAVATAASHTVTATNTGGSATVAVTITVNDVAPSNLSYSVNPAVYIKGTAIAPNVPSNGGGAVLSYSVSPALPAGLSLNATTGVISGTPTVLAAAANYTVTATNSGGSTTVGVNIAVKEVAPSGLTYSTNPATYTKGMAIAPNTPSSGGGAPASYSVSPALPAGLSLNTTTGVISGTPTALAATASYTVTATNTAGSATVGVSITINDVAPSGLGYSSNPAVYVLETAIVPNTPGSSGGAVVSYSVSPALPAGLNLNTTTGIISGTPTAITAAGGHTVTATNSGGSATVSVSITVTDRPPMNLIYSTNPATYTKGVAITPNTPSQSGGTVLSYSVSPALPAGLSFSTSTGVISGTPTAVTATASYTVTATNGGGSATVGVSITINDVPPSNLTYSSNPAVYTLGTAVPVNVPSTTGGTVVSYSVLPALPAGLGLNTTTGIISGIPTAVTVAGSHTITATNSGGSTTASVSITVNPLLPSRYAFAANSAESTISMYTVDGTTGRLRANGYVAAGTNPRSITVDPSGKFAYAANIGSGNVSAYTITASNGRLNPIGSPVTAGSRPFSVAIHPTGRFAFVPNFDSNDVSAFTINQTTGALVSVGPTVPAGTGARALTVDPTGRFAYVVNETSNDVSAYAINGSTGVLTSLGPRLAAGMAPISVTVDPTGSFVYVANQNSNDVSAYAINPSTGALTSVGAAVAAGTTPSSVTVDPSGKFVYVANTDSNGVSAYRLNATTGALTSLGTPVTASSPIWIAIDPSGEIAYAASFFTNQITSFSLNTSTGALTPLALISARSSPSWVALAQGSTPVAYVPKFAYVANSGSTTVSAYTVNASSGALTAVGTTATGTTPTSVAVDPLSRFAYVANSGSANVSAYAINASSGALTSVGAASAATGPSSVAVDPSSNFVYVANKSSNTVSAFTINQSTGVLTSVGAVATGSAPTSVTVDPSGRFAYVANSGTNDVSAYTINASTGALTSIGATVAAGTGPASVVVESTGIFVYVANGGSNDVSLYVLSATTGALTSLGSSVGAGTGPSAICVNPAGPFTYVANSGGNSVSGFNINETSGALTSVGAAAGAGTTPASVTIDVSGAFVYVANSGANTVSAFTLSSSTGVLSSIGSPVSAGTTPHSVVVAGVVQ